MNNRAMEFLCSAKGSFPRLHDRWGWKAKHYIDLAIDEVQELLDRIAELEGQTTTADGDGRGVLIVTTATPSRLAARQTAALPGNGKGL